ncbi:MAG: hypothetical protein CM15mV75_550 [uncultured marine virus]|nr:MAG: hypothetical protein CM15mV75_550 [uncultured marine virus]
MSDMSGLTIRGGHKRSTKSGAGLTQKGVNAYRRKNLEVNYKQLLLEKLKPVQKMQSVENLSVLDQRLDWRTWKGST